jgi:ankyrin repeat protein
MRAAQNPNLAVTEALLRAGASIAAEDTLGRTPLFWAARYNDNPAVLQRLIDAGADLRHRDAANNTVWDLLRENDGLIGTAPYQQIRSLFEQ